MAGQVRGDGGGLSGKCSEGMAFQRGGGTER